MEAISVLGVVSKLSKDVPLESVKDLVDSLVDKYTVLAANITTVTDAWSCVFCSYVLEEPVTLICGHSCCRKCLTKNLTSVCKKCKTKYTPIEDDPIDPEPYIKLNILICELVKKYWSKELEATRLREEGNRLFQRNQVSDSISKYSEAVLLCPEDYLCLSNRSNAHYKNNNLEAALSDADMSIQCKPDWGRSYLRKGMALSALHKYEDAIAALIKGYILENSGSKLLKMEIVKTMHKLIQTKGKETEDYLPTSNVVKSPIMFSSQPNLNRDSSDGEDTEDDVETRTEENRKLLISKNTRLCAHLRRIDESVQSFIRSVKSKSERDIDPNAVNKDDFECSLCFR